MRYATRVTLALGFVGAVAVAGVAFGQDGPDGRDGGVHEMGALGIFPGPHHRGPMLFGTVYGERKVATDDGFATHRVDSGEITAVDGSTVTITRADDEVVTVAADDDTAVSRNREDADVSDLEVGDHALVVRVDDAVKAIHALDAEAYEDLSEVLEGREELWDRMRERHARLRHRLGERLGERFERFWGHGAEDAA